MARDRSTQAFISRRLFLVALLGRSVRADPDIRCPDYVANHAPIVWLHSQDLYRPTDLLTHIRHTTPAREGELLHDLPSLDLDNLEVLDELGGRVALTSNDNPLSQPEWILGEAPDAGGRIRNSTPCCVILVEKSELIVDAFYFYFYSYNEGPNITQVMEPLNRLIDHPEAAAGMHFGNHVGDWEHNMVRFEDGKPIGIYYSQHRGGRAYDWDDPDINTKNDGRPIVYSALGSHANYALPGEQVHDKVLIDYCDAGQKWDPILSAYFYRLDPTTFTLTRLDPPTKVSSPPPSSNLTSFFYFSGIWGDAEYPNSDSRQRTIKRFGLKRFLSGPTGPRHKQLLRKGLLPDRRRKETWMEWGVGIFMALYPCCIKGWRAWVSMGFVILILVGIALGVRVGVRKYRTRAYRKVQGDDIQLDEWRREEEGLLASSDEEDGEECDR